MSSFNKENDEEDEVNVGEAQAQNQLLNQENDHPDSPIGLDKQDSKGSLGMRRMDSSTTPVKNLKGPKVKGKSPSGPVDKSMASGQGSAYGLRPGQGDFPIMPKTKKGKKGSFGLTGTGNNVMMDK